MNAQVRIERYADQGRCVGHIDGRVVFVRFALPGELVQVALDEPHDRDDRYWTGEVVEVIEPSPDRVDPAWPLAGPLAMGGGVGGADLVHVSLEGQLRWKAATISDQMSRLGHVDVTVPVERAEGDTENGGLRWRTRIEMIADDDGMPSMRRRGSHKRVPLDTMPLATDNLLAVADREHVWDGGFEPANGFWQVHRQAPVMLAGHVIDLANKALDGMTSACIWDLYSGAGLFTLPLATMTAERTRMLSVEGGKTAVKNAQRNLRALNLPDVDARCGDVSATLAHVPAHLSRPDLVVLDPPRAGAHAKVCRQIAQAGAKDVIYVACDPTSLARDTATLISLGYRLSDIRAYDIYPMTHHVETVAWFTRIGR